MTNQFKINASIISLIIDIIYNNNITSWAEAMAAAKYVKYMT